MNKILREICIRRSWYSWSTKLYVRVRDHTAFVKVHAAMNRIMRSGHRDTIVPQQRYEIQFHSIRMHRLYTDGIQKGDLPLCSRQSEERRPPRWGTWRESQRSLKQRWQSFVVIRIILLDASNALYLLRRVASVSLYLSDPSNWSSLSVGRSTSSSVCGTARSTSWNYKQDERNALDTLFSPNYSTVREIFGEFLYQMWIL